MDFQEKSSDFCSDLRRETRSIHAESDRLVNLKLAVALTDVALYADTLSQFYFVFRSIEEGLRRVKKTLEEGPGAGDGRIQALYLDPMLRTEAFERDLEFFLGPEWKQRVKPSTQAQAYCDRIFEVADTQPILLVAYVHTMYLALTAGGQILKGLIRRTLGLSGDNGLGIFEFSDLKHQELRKLILERINGLELSQVERDAIIQEAVRIFQMNNSLAANVKLSWRSSRRLALITLVVVAAISSCSYVLYAALKRK